MAEDFFNQEEASQQPDPKTVTKDDMVGEGKKFKDVDGLAQGKAYADMYIEDLKARVEDLTNRLNEATSKGSNLEDLKRELSNLNAQTANQEGTDTSSTDVRVKDEVELSTLVAQELDKRNQQDATNRNLEVVNQALTKKFGEGKEAEAIKLLAQRLNSSPEFLKDVAAKSPDAFLKLMGEERVGSEAPIEPAFNTSAGMQPGGGAGPRQHTEAWYLAKMKEMGMDAYYADSSLQRQKMHDLENNPDFFN